MIVEIAFGLLAILIIYAGWNGHRYEKNLQVHKAKINKIINDDFRLEVYLVNVDREFISDLISYVYAQKAWQKLSD